MSGECLEITPFFRVPISEIEFSFVRSSGPGGQNVNKVNSKAMLRWNLLQSQNVGEVLRIRLIEKLQAKLTREGEIIISSDTHRDQGKNRDACLEKLKELLRAASVIPKARKKTKPSFSSTLRVKSNKKRQSEKKKFRSGRGDE